MVNTPAIIYTLSLHDALPISAMRKLKAARDRRPAPFVDRTAYVNWNAMMAGAFLQAGAVLDRPECNALALDRKSTRLNSSHRCISYAVFFLKKKKQSYINK